MINAAVLFTVAWTFWNGDTAGALAHLPAALIGLVVVDAGVPVVAHRLPTRTAEVS